jgi:hypothetical protein
MSKPEGDLPREKPDFLDIFTRYALTYEDLLRIALDSGVTSEVVREMLFGNPVKHSEAEALLKAFSEHVRHAWTMDNTRVPTFPEDREDEQHE